MRKKPDMAESALALFFDGVPEEMTNTRAAVTAIAANEGIDLHKGARQRRRAADPPIQDDAALRLWLMSNSPARALRVLAEYAEEAGRECTADREFPRAGKYEELGRKVRSVFEWAREFVELS